MKKKLIKKHSINIGILCLCILSACGSRDAAPENIVTSVTFETEQEQEMQGSVTADSEIIPEQYVEINSDQIYSEDILNSDFPVVKPQKAFMLYVYMGEMRFLLYVDENGLIQEAEPEYEEYLWLFEDLDIIGKPYKEGFAYMLESISAKGLINQIEVMWLNFVSHEADNARWLMENGIGIASDFLAKNDLSHIPVSSTVVVYLKDSSSAIYNFFEKYCPKTYKEIKDWFVKYEGDYATEDANISSSYDGNGNLIEIHIIGGYYGINLYWVPGTEVYKLRRIVENERETAIFWPDGKVDSFVGDKGIRTKIPGEIGGVGVYLPDVEVDDCQEAMALLDKYRDTAVIQEDTQDFLYIARDDGDTRIFLYHDGNELIIKNESADARYCETYAFVDQQFSSRSKAILDEYLRTIYSYYETTEEIREYTIDFEECIEVTNLYNKKTDETWIFSDKMIRDGNTYTWYRLRWEDDRELYEYEYVSKDSNVLKSFTGTDKRNGEIFYWELDGKDPGEEEYNNRVVSLTRTLNGVSKTYSFNQIPWGSGIIYPPHRYHEFIGQTVTYELEKP